MFVKADECALTLTITKQSQSGSHFGHSATSWVEDNGQYLPYCALSLSNLTRGSDSNLETYLASAQRFFWKSPCAIAEIINCASCDLGAVVSAKTYDTSPISHSRWNCVNDKFVQSCIGIAEST